MHLKKEIGGMILFGNDKFVGRGDTVAKTDQIVSIPVGSDDYLGRIVDSLGYVEFPARALIDTKAPGRVERESVRQSLFTGIKAVNSLVKKKLYKINSFFKKTSLGTNLNTNNLLLSFVVKRNFSSTGSTKVLDAFKLQVLDEVKKNLNDLETKISHEVKNHLDTAEKEKTADFVVIGLFKERMSRYEKK